MVKKTPTFNLIENHSLVGVAKETNNQKCMYDEQRSKNPTWSADIVISPNCGKHSSCSLRKFSIHKPHKHSVEGRDKVKDYW